MRALLRSSLQQLETCLTTSVDAPELLLEASAALAQALALALTLTLSLTLTRRFG